MQEALLADLLTFTRDGEWGNGEPTEGFSPALVVRGTDFERVRLGNLDTLPLRYIRSDILKRKTIIAGDTLIETAGGTKDQPTGRSVFIPASVVEAAEFPLVCASFARFLRPDPNRIDPQFLFWKLQDEYHSRRMMPYHVQHTGVARFQYTQFAENYPLPLPPLPEQRAIAATLGALDDKIELNRKMNATLEAMARALFRDWFVDFGPTRAKMEGAEPYLSPDLWSLFPDRLDDEGKPEGWEVFKLEQIADHHTRAISPAQRPDEVFEHFSLPAYDKGQSPSLDCGETIKSNKTLVPPGAVLLSKLNPEIPRVWLPQVPNERRQIASTEFLSYTGRNGAQRGLLFCMFSDDDFRQMLQGMVTGTSKSHQRISPPDLLRREVLTGKADLFEHFEDMVAPLLKRVLTNRAESRTLAQTRDLLLPKFMSCEIRPNYSEDLV